MIGEKTQPVLSLTVGGAQKIVNKLSGLQLYTFSIQPSALKLPGFFKNIFFKLW